MANISGTGLLSPLRRSGSSDFESGSGIDVLKSRVREILGTIADSGTSSGELPWDTEFGSSRLISLKHKNLEGIEDFARSFIFEAVRTHEPGAIVTRIETDKDEKAKTLRLRVFIREASQDTPENLVASLSEEDFVDITI